MKPRSAHALRGRLLTSATVLALCATPAAAQEADGFFQMLGRIILGAGTAKVAIDTPQAVTALEQEDIDRLQPEHLADLFKGIPGVQIAGASSRALGQAFNIRGVGSTDQTASEERIKVTVDGAPKFFEGYRMGSFFGDLDLFKRVEVLRGPASSTLYGSGAIGGVVAFTTKDASDFLTEDQNSALRFKANYGSNGDTQGLSAIYAYRAGNAEFLAALNGSTGDEVVDGDGVEIAGTAHKSYSGLFKGKWVFGNDNDQSFVASFSRTDTDLDDTAVVQTGGAANIIAFGYADIHTIDDTLTLTYDHGFAGNDLLDLTVQLSFTDTNVEKRNFHGAFFMGQPLTCAPGRNSILCDSDYGYQTTALKVENTSDLSYGAWENYLTVGVQLSEQERTASYVSTAGVPGTFDFHPEGTDKRAAFYVQGEFTWNERLTLIPGLRVEFADRTPTEASVAVGAEAASDTAVSPKLALLYKMTDDLSVFGSYAQTERLPNLDELYSSSTAPVRVPSLNLEKEEAETFELGLAYQQEGLLSGDDSLQMKATIFHNDIKNLIRTDSTAAPGSANYFNIDNAAIWGGELELAYDAERWFASMAWSSIKSKNKAADSGLTLPDTPSESVALTVGYKVPDRGLVFGWRGYYFDSITSYSVTKATTGINAGQYTPSQTPSHDVHDLFVTWAPTDGALAGIEVNFSVENVFDETYRNNLATDNAPGRNAKLAIAKNFTW